MICPIFYDNSINLDKDYLYDELVVDYLILKSCNSDIDEVGNEIKAFYFDAKINQRQFKKYFKNHSYLLKPTNKLAVAYQVERFVNQYSHFLNKSKEELYKIACSFLKESSINFYELMACVCVLDKQMSGKDDIYYQSLLANVVLNENRLSIELDNTILEIKDFYDDIPIKQIIRNPLINEILFTSGIDSIGNLKLLSVNSLLGLFSIDYEGTIGCLSYLQKDCEQNLKENIDAIFGCLDERMLQIIDFRYGFNKEPATLEETSHLYGITRERVRQIESKAEKKLLSKRNEANAIIVGIFHKIANGNGNFVSRDYFDHFCGDCELSNKILCLIQILNFSIRYDSELKIIYDADVSTPEEFADEMLDLFGCVIDKENTESLTICEKAILNKYYRLCRNAIYLRRGMSMSDAMADIIDEVLPNGYKIADDDTYNLLCRETESKFGSEFQMSSRRALDARISGRDDFCLIGRGLYKRRTQCPSLPEELVNKIIEYVAGCSPVCSYRTIYGEFKRELEEIGIDNFYYLKGLLDPLLPEGFHSARDYIRTTEQRISAKGAILSTMASFDYIFTVDDVKTKCVGLKGVEDYVFYFALNDEAENNGLIFLENQKYVYLKKLQLAQDTMNELKKSIDNLFASLAEPTISARKIYARLSFINPQLVEKLKVCNGHFSLFSLIKALFPNDYGYKRPLISKDKTAKVSYEDLLYEYASRLDGFGSLTISRYVEKMNIKGLYSYLTFMENMSDKYVQIGMDSMIKKELLGLSQDTLNHIDELLSLIINNLGKIDTTAFNGYYMLPKIRYQWNKYLLVGIVRTYLSDKFEIENTKTNYRETDFIIRGIK